MVKNKKRVLDIGSGGGRLCKELTLLKERGLFKGEVEVFSLDLHYAFPEGRSRELQETYRVYGGSSASETFYKINKTFVHSAVAANWRNIPYGNGFFDGILASFSSGLYAKGNDKYRIAFQEMERVLQEGGDGFITVLGVDNDQVTGMTENVNETVSLPLKDIKALNPQPFTSKIICEGLTLLHSYIRISK